MRGVTAGIDALGIQTVPFPYIVLSPSLSIRNSLYRDRGCSAGYNVFRREPLHDLKTHLTLKWWPSLQDYNEAIQMPQVSLQDTELKKGLPYTTPLGLPRPITGAFASVYRMHCEQSDYALRLFLRNIDDQAERYALISDFVQHDSLPYTVTFDFLSKGIKTRNDWFPALKMEWVEGVPFEEYIVANLKEPHALAELSRSFLQMMNELRFAGIAHGDLQHGNIIICGNELRLVDYDGMYVPAMKHFMASELGHPNYQHPSRGAHHFGPYLDNFSAWIIYASIKALELDPRLLNQLGGGDDCLLFRRSDFLEPLLSPAFSAFEKHENHELRALGSFVRTQLANNLEDIPFLQLPIPETTVQLQAIPDAVSGVKSGPRLVRGDLSDWLQNENVDVLLKPGGIKPEPRETLGMNPNSWVVQAQPVAPAAWIKPAASPSSFNATSYASAYQATFAGAGVAGIGGVSAGTSGSTAPSLLPAELANNPVPRPVKFNRRGTNCPPEAYQALMVLFPCVWIMLFQFYTVYSIDEELRTNAKVYSASVVNVNRYKTSSKSGTTEHTDVTATYKVGKANFTAFRDMGADGGRFKVGDKYPVRALPNKPDVHEPLDAVAGTQQCSDISWAIFNLFVTILMEIWIWLKPLRHRFLAKNGDFVSATITALPFKLGPKGELYYYATVRYTVDGHTYDKNIRNSKEDHGLLTIGLQEILLYSPGEPGKVIFYRFCLYQPVLSAQQIQAPVSSQLVPQSKMQTRP